MSVERCDLIDLCHRQTHDFGKGAQMGCGKMTESVLNQMKIFDQPVALRLLFPKKVHNLFKSGPIELAPARELPRFAPSRLRKRCA